MMSLMTRARTALAPLLFTLVVSLGLPVWIYAPALAQTAIPDPMAGAIPNPMVPMANPMQPMQTPTAQPQVVAPNPMTPTTAPNPMLPGGAIPNPMAGTPTGDVEEVALRPDLGNLPDTAGVEDTYFMCTACHSAATFAQQRLTDARWEYLWDWMISDQNMPDYGPEARETILAYLQTHFSSQR